ncbi:MAG TPA: hypothetical protein VHZ99_13480 [Steroidobacteraceae bacterium]|jgi:hypothetical protein|nr:hypothetical protein [Steroidobacteraceae bacterium]
MTVQNRLLAAVTAAVLTVGLAASPAMAQDAPAPAPANATGSWQPHKYRFDFMGFTTTYTCDGLADKLRLLLRTMGAEPGFKINESCSRGFDQPDKLASAYLTFASLQPVASGPAVEGSWQHVELAPNHPFDLGRGECELIEQFRDRVLPLFAVRNVVNNVTCVPYQDVGSDFRLSFDVFAPVKPPKGAKPAATK